MSNEYERQNRYKKRKKALRLMKQLTLVLHNSNQKGLGKSDAEIVVRSKEWVELYNAVYQHKESPEAELMRIFSRPLEVKNMTNIYKLCLDHIKETIRGLNKREPAFVYRLDNGICEHCEKEVEERWEISITTIQ